MTIKKFRTLDINEQANNIVWAGTFLSSLMNDKYRIHLYSVCEFYVKVYYSKDVNEIIRIRSFRSTKLIEAYLEQINIDGLLNEL